MSNKTSYNDTVFSPSLVKIALWTTVFVILDIAILVGNALVLHYYFNLRCTRGRPRAHYFFINLAIMDELVALVSVPLYIYFLITFLQEKLTPNNDLFYHIFTASDVITGYGSMFTVVLISIDRFGAVVLPFRHRVITRNMYLYSILTTWLIACTIAGIYLSTFITNSNYRIIDYVSASFFLGAILVVIPTNLIIVFRAPKNELRQQHIVYHKKLSRTFKLVVIAFFCTWVPFLCLNYAHVIMENFRVIPLFVSHLAKVLQYGGSFINCLIYYRNNREFKSSIMRLFSIHKRSKKYQVSDKHISLEITNHELPWERPAAR